ncbi:phage major capsid protein [Prevotella koreensis]
MNSLEIKDKRKQLQDRALNIIDTCKKEVRDLTEDEETELKDLKEKIKEKDEELKQLQKTLEELSFDEDGEDNKEDDRSEEEEEKTENKSNSNIRKQMNKKKFSLIKAIRSIANNTPLDDVTLAVINAGSEEARKAGVNAQGQIQLPTEERAVISVAAEGEDVVATDLFDILTPLRAKNILINAGAKFLSNLVGNVQVPVMSKSNVTWEGETAKAKDGAGSFKHITLSPKRLTAYVDISKQMIAQDSIGVENAIRADLVNAINAKLEETILGDAAGTASQPEGIFKTIIPTAVADFTAICNKESELEDANVLGECVYIMSNKAKASLRSMAKSSKSTQLVYENGEVDGTKAFNTSNVTDKKYIYGDFSNLAIGSWGGVDLTVDPYTKAGEGQIRIVVNMYVDAQILRNEAFTTGKLGS